MQLDWQNEKDSDGIEYLVIILLDEDRAGKIEHDRIRIPLSRLVQGWDVAGAKGQSNG